MSLTPYRTRRAALIAALLLSTAAAAQWAWKDENGRVVYSDRPPPASVAPDRIVRQPGGNALNAAGASADAKGDAKAAGPKTWAERETEYKKRQTERADAEKKSNEEQAQQAQRRADCERARSYAATIESGTRIVRTDAKGERAVLDDDQRAAELARARELIARSCN
jgi:hypothetical protein